MCFLRICGLFRIGKGFPINLGVRSWGNGPFSWIERKSFSVQRTRHERAGKPGRNGSMSFWKSVGEAGRSTAATASLVLGLMLAGTSLATAADPLGVDDGTATDLVDPRCDAGPRRSAGPGLQRLAQEPGHGHLRRDRRLPDQDRRRRRRERSARSVLGRRRVHAELDVGRPVPGHHRPHQQHARHRQGCAGRHRRRHLGRQEVRHAVHRRPVGVDVEQEAVQAGRPRSREGPGLARRVRRRRPRRRQARQRRSRHLLGRQLRWLRSLHLDARSPGPMARRS